MTATVSGIHLGPDTHANLPVATVPPAGSLYSCSTHSLIYRTNGSAWSTWATLGGGGGSSAVTISDTDPGAIGAGALWLRADMGNFVFSLLIRNEDDDDWYELSLAAYNGSALIKNIDAGGILRYRNSGSVITADLSGNPTNGGGFRFNARDETTGDPTTSLNVGPNTVAQSLVTGTADPSAASGVASLVGSTYLRNVGGLDTTGELWVKTGAADTAWTKVV